MKQVILPILVSIILVTTVNAGEIKDATTSLRQSFNRLGIDVVMRDITGQMNSQAPMSLGQASILESFTYSDKTLVSKIVIDKKSTKLVRSSQGENFKNKIREASANHSCNTVENRMFLNNGIKIKHDYYSEKNKFLYSNIFSKNDCLHK